MDGLTTAVAPGRDAPAGRVTGTVLLVDDCPDTREMYAEVLSSIFDVAQAATAGEALAMASALRPGAIVMDRVLPDMTGEEVIRLLRRDSRTAHIPVVVVSGLTDPRRGAAPWNAYLVKPCHPAALLECLERLMDRPAAGDGPSQRRGTGGASLLDEESR